MSRGLILCPGTDGARCPDGALIAPGRRGCSTCTSPRRERPDRPRQLTVGEQLSAAKKDAAAALQAEHRRRDRWRR